MLVTKVNPHGGDIYKVKINYDFSSNVNPLGTPREVIEAVCEASSQLSAYPDPYCRKLRSLLSKKECVNENHIICGNGAADLIYLFAATLKPRKVLIVVPTFCEYEDSYRNTDTKIEYYQLDRKTQYQLSEHFLKQVNKEYQAIYLCNPNNPTGALIDSKLMHKIANRCLELEIRLFVDECFLDWTDQEQKDTVSTLICKNPYLFVIKAFTKSYGMAGVRLGYALCSDENFLSKMEEASQTWNVSTVAQMAGIKALSCRYFLEEAKQIVRIEREYLKTSLSKLNCVVYPGSANYLLFESIAGLEQSLLKRGIKIRCCDNFYGLTKQHYRIAVKQHEENVILIQNIKEIMYG